MIIFDKEETKDAFKSCRINPETILSIFKEKTKKRVWCITEKTPELPYIHFNNDLQDIANEINNYNANKLKMLDVEKNALRVRIIKEINEFVINAFQTKCDTGLQTILTDPKTYLIFKQSKHSWKVSLKTQTISIFKQLVMAKPHRTNETIWMPYRSKR